MGQTLVRRLKTRLSNLPHAGMRCLLWLFLRLRLYYLLFPARKRLASRYVSGSGIEIGALHHPLPVPKGVVVRYVDKMTAAELQKNYAELSMFRLTPVDIIDDGETLETIGGASQDFIIANHFIEHCENPLQTLINHLSKLKPGGMIFLAVPEKEKTFDRRRPSTSLDHLARDYQNGPEWSRFDHYLEWSRLKENLPEDEADVHARALMTAGYRIHFHVWRKADFLSMLEYVRTALHQPFTVREAAEGRHEFIIILQKSPALD